MKKRKIRMKIYFQNEPIQRLGVLRRRSQSQLGGNGIIRILFSFKSEDDLCKIMSLGPWSVMGCLMVLRKWDGLQTLEKWTSRAVPFGSRSKDFLWDS